MDIDDQPAETMVPMDRPTCPHCDPFQICLEATSRELDEIELKVERRFNELLMRMLDMIISNQRHL
jgi:hypothetical protein